jgi:hypothetical protein
VSRHGEGLKKGFHEDFSGVAMREAAFLALGQTVEMHEAAHVS